MTAWTVHDEFAAMRARFHRALGVSVGLHALLAAAILMVEGARPRVPEIIEVTWLEPEAAAVAVANVPAPAPEPARTDEADRPLPAGPAAARSRDEAQREPGRGDNGAKANRDDAVRAGRLEALAASRVALAASAALAPPSTAARAALAAAPDPAAGLARAAAATMMPLAERGRPVALERGTGPGPGPGSAALALQRGPARSGSLAGLATAALPAATGNGTGDDGRGGPAAARDIAQSGGDGGVGTAPGDILLEGPAAGREVVQRVLPAYPAWARKQAVEAIVTLRFTVLPDGRVREDVAVERTGGFRDFDESAVAALHGWRFAPLAGGDAAGQWGTITFRFRLRG